MYPLISYTLKCLIFSKLLKIDNVSAKIDILSYTKSLESRKISVPLLLETGTKPKPKSSLTILIAKTQTEKGSAFYVCLPFVIMLYKNG